MHGSIEVHSAEGKGTIFNIVLPINCTEPVSRHFDLANTIIQEGFDENFEEETVNEDIIHDDRENATRILIVEDTPEVARLQMNQLNPDFNYYFARNGREGLEKAKEIVPDLIITFNGSNQSLYVDQYGRLSISTITIGTYTLKAAKEKTCTVTLNITN